MHTTEPSTTDHPLLARLPVAAGAVCLRAFRTDDVDDFLAYRSDPEVAPYQGWQPMDREAALVFLQAAAPSPWREGDWARAALGHRVRSSELLTSALTGTWPEVVQPARPRAAFVRQICGNEAVARNVGSTALGDERLLL